MTLSQARSNAHLPGKITIQTRVGARFVSKLTSEAIAGRPKSSDSVRLQNCDHFVQRLPNLDKITPSQPFSDVEARLLGVVAQCWNARYYLNLSHIKMFSCHHVCWYSIVKEVVGDHGLKDLSVLFERTYKQTNKKTDLVPVVRKTIRKELMGK